MNRIRDDAKGQKDEKVKSIDKMSWNGNAAVQLSCDAGQEQDQRKSRVTDTEVGFFQKRGVFKVCFNRLFCIS